MYPDQVQNLALVNPISLEPYTAKGLPYLDIDDNTLTSSQSTWESLKKYEQTSYYASNWQDFYDEWVTMVYNIFQGSQKERYWINQAQTVDVVLTQPVAFELSHLQSHTLLLIRQKDRTAIGAAWSPPDVAATLGNWTELCYQAASLIPNVTLHAFPDLGHAPQISAPQQFNAALVEWFANEC